MAKSASLVSRNPVERFPVTERAIGNFVKQQKRGLVCRGQPGEIPEAFDAG